MWPLVSTAQEPGRPPNGSTWLTVADATLDELRGGFDLGAGIVVSFGITREVYLNGTLAATTSFQIADASKVTAAQAAMIERQLGDMRTIQNGPGNSIELVPKGIGGTVVQNSLNNQHIRTQTVLDATTNGMSLMKGLNTGAVLRDALMNSATR